MTPRAVTDVDADIGEAIRARRKDLGLRQGDVAEHVGVTTQQFQKYEAGDNRISAAMLLRIAEILEMAPEELLPGSATHPRKSPSADVMALQLQRAFARIRSKAERKMVLDLARRFGEATPAAKAKSKR